MLSPLDITAFALGIFDDILTYWKTKIASGALPDLFLVIITVITLIELAVTVYRTLRYGQRGKKA